MIVSFSTRFGGDSHWAAGDGRAGQVTMWKPPGQSVPRLCDRRSRRCIRFSDVEYSWPMALSLRSWQGIRTRERRRNPGRGASGMASRLLEKRNDEAEEAEFGVAGAQVGMAETARSQ